MFPSDSIVTTEKWNGMRMNKLRGTLFFVIYDIFRVPNLFRSLLRGSLKQSQSRASYPKILSIKSVMKTWDNVEFVPPYRIGTPYDCPCYTSHGRPGTF